MFRLANGSAKKYTYVHSTSHFCFIILAPAEPKEDKEKPPAVTRSGRVSKRASNFEIPVIPAEKKVAEKAEYKFDAPGVNLGSIPRAQYWIGKCDSEDLKTLFKVCFNRIGKNSEVKQQLRKFNRFNYPDYSKDYQFESTSSRGELRSHTLSRLR